MTVMVRRRPTSPARDLRAQAGEPECARVVHRTTAGDEYVCRRPAGHANGCAGEWQEGEPVERPPDWRERQAGDR